MTSIHPDLDFMQAGAQQAADLMRLLSNPHRLILLCLLIEHGEMSVGAMQAQLDLSQSALSQHLARLREESLVQCRRESQTIYYSLADQRVATIVGTLKSVFCPSGVER